MNPPEIPEEFRQNYQCMPHSENLRKKPIRFRSDDILDELDPSPPMESQMQPRLKRPANSIFIISTSP